jgi:hypothetical protein
MVTVSAFLVAFHLKISMNFGKMERFSYINLVYLVEIGGEEK